MKRYKKYFVNVIEKEFPDTSGNIISATDAHYKDIAADTKFAFTSKNPVDKRLDFCAYFLALIKTLDVQGENYETTRRICLEVVTSYVQPRNKFQKFLKRLPAMLMNMWFTPVLINAFHKKVSQNSNSQGFVANIITDKTVTYGLGYGIDILECGICKLFKKHNYEKYSSILCEVDKITSGLAGLELIRTGTIAMGAKKCDFRFRKVV